MKHIFLFVYFKYCYAYFAFFFRACLNICMHFVNFNSFKFQVFVIRVNFIKLCSYISTDIFFTLLFTFFIFTKNLKNTMLKSSILLSSNKLNEII